MIEIKSEPGVSDSWLHRWSCDALPGIKSEDVSVKQEPEYLDHYSDTAVLKEGIVPFENEEAKTKSDDCYKLSKSETSQGTIILSLVTNSSTPKQTSLLTDVIQDCNPITDERQENSKPSQTRNGKSGIQCLWCKFCSDRENAMIWHCRVRHGKADNDNDVKAAISRFKKRRRKSVASSVHPNHRQKHRQGKNDQENTKRKRKEKAAKRRRQRERNDSCSTKDCPLLQQKRICTICELGFTQKGSVKRHLKSIHKMSDWAADRLTAFMAPDRREKKKCPWCKGLKSKLNDHLKYCMVYKERLQKD